MNKKNKIKLVIPKGRMYKKIKSILSDAGIKLEDEGRNYRPKVSDPEIEIKLLKPQNIAKLVEIGQHDIGFTGYDWIYEKEADVIEIFDTKLDKVKIVSAVPRGFNLSEKNKIIVASEYSRVTREYLNKKKWNSIYIQTYGATEVFPPEDADMIIDNTSTGSTLRDNNLEIIETIMESSTRFIANKKSYSNTFKKKKINQIKMLIESVIMGRKKVMLEMNIIEDKLEFLTSVLPCMRSPTVNKLKDGGYAVKVAVNKVDSSKAIIKAKQAGATDILEYELNKVVI